MFQLRSAVFRTASSAAPCLLSSRISTKISPFAFRALSFTPSPSPPTFSSRKFTTFYPRNDDERFGYGSAEDRMNSQGSNNSSFSRDRPFSAPVDIPPNSSIYVGNLSFHVTEDDIKKEFESFGPIKNLKIATDPRGLSKGFGYIEFESTEKAREAIASKDQTVFEGRRLIVNYQAQSKRNTQENPPSKTLFVGNLAFELTDAELNKIFSEIRNVVDVRVAVDRRTGMPRGFAHADFISVEDAVKAKELLTDREVLGRKLRVDFSAGVRGSPSADSRD